MVVAPAAIGAGRGCPAGCMCAMLLHVEHNNYVQSPGTILLAATPIGKTDDASTRLVRAIEQANVIAAEDTRRLRGLCSRLGIEPGGRVLALHEHNENHKARALVETAATGQRVLLVSDAGMPTVSDPGYRVVQTAIAAGVRVSALPGPSAVLTALAVSGLPTDRFCFEGFLPRKGKERKHAIAQLVTEERTTIFFESPRRLHTTLVDLAAVCGKDRQAVVCRELTKTHEEILRGTLQELARATAGEVLGEITIVMAGAAPQVADPQDHVQTVLELMQEGMRLKDAAAQVARATGLRKNELYDAALAAK